MFLIDQWVEKHIQHAQENGEFDNLPGSGQPLILDDDSGVPEALRTAYRILKNAGYLPPELQDRKEVMELDHMLNVLTCDDPLFSVIEKRLKVLLLRLQQAGMNIDLLHGRYKEALKDNFGG
ncbi:DnaJ family domain-containing protein [Rahnella sp. PCH160]|uniref:DnaJ family domain-containing protein n=1 Tax=Rahnella sp. PCH160 TaxID=3447928 RepID=UPI0039FD24A8